MSHPHHPRRHRRALPALALTLVVALSNGVTSALADGWPTRPYYYFLHWVSMGQVDDALAQFADDAVVVAGPLCTLQRPCVGKADIRARYIVPLLGHTGALPVADARFDGRVLRAQGELPSEPRVLERNRRRAAEHMFEFRDDQISSLRAEPGERDLPAATLVKRDAANAATAGR
jgi:hypothetical protein